MLNGIKNVLFWNYARGTWQYDLLCILIIAGLFVWPEPKHSRAKAAGQTTVLVDSDGNTIQNVSFNELRDFLQARGRQELLNSPREAVVFFLQAKAQTAVSLVALEPYGDGQGGNGYRAHFRGQ